MTDLSRYRRADRSPRLAACIAAVPACILLAIGLALGQDSPPADSPPPTGPLYPLAVAVSPSGDRFVADRELPGIWKISKDASEPTIVFRASRKLRSPLNAIRCVRFDREGRLLAGDSATRQVYRVADDGSPTPLVQNAAGIGIPMDIAATREGELLVADLELRCIWKLPAAGGEAKVWAKVDAPRGLAVDEQDRVWVVSNRRVLRLGANGKPETIAEDARFQFLNQLVLDDKNVAYVSDGYARSIWRVVAGEKPIQWVRGEPLVNPVGLARDGDRLLIADPRAKTIFTVGADGKLAK